VGAQRAGVGSHAKVATHETSEMDAGQVVVAECKIATVNVVGRHWALVANWMLENRYSLVPYAGVDTMSSRVVVHSVVGGDAAAEDGARVQSLGLKQNQAQCTHSEKVRCCRDTHRQNVNRQTRTADQYYWERTEEVQVDHAFVRQARRTLAQQAFRKRRIHASCPEWTHTQTIASSLRRTERLFLYYCHGNLGCEGNQRASRVGLGPLSDS
jgi:hypothetical protein